MADLTVTDTTAARVRQSEGPQVKAPVNRSSRPALSHPEGRAVGVTPTSYTIECNAKQASTNRCDGRPGAGGRA